MTTDELATKSKKQSGFLIVIIISIITILVGGLMFRMGQLNKKGPGITPTSSSTISPTKEVTLSPTITTAVTTVEPSPTLAPESTPTLTPTPEPTTTLTPTPTTSPQADLYISEYSFNHPPKSGEAFTVKIGIYNKGNKAASGFWWEWWPTHANYACRQRIDSLAAHGGRIVYCTYTYSSWSTYATKAVADSGNEIVESDETNNTFTQNVIPIH